MSTGITRPLWSGRWWATNPTLAVVIRLGPYRECSRWASATWDSGPSKAGPSSPTSRGSKSRSVSIFAISGGSGSVTMSTATPWIVSCSTCWQASTGKSNMPDSRTLEPLISRLFAEKLNVDVPSVETDLIETGLVDSLIFVEFLAELEEGFGIHLSLEDLEIDRFRTIARIASFVATKNGKSGRSEEHTSELQSLAYLVCRLLLEKKKTKYSISSHSGQ